MIGRILAVVACLHGSMTVDVVKSVSDQPPTIQLRGPVLLRIPANTQGLSYQDVGATAFDEEDGDITSRIVVDSNVKLNLPNTYYVIFTVQDSSGQQAGAVRRVDIVDFGKPSLSLLGASEEVVSVGEKWEDPGAQAMDEIDGDLSEWIEISGSVDTSTIGTYLLVYSVYDDSGNYADDVNRTVTVQDSVSHTPRLSTCCLFNQGTMGCDQPAVESCVCEKDSFCCNGHWDETCAQRAQACMNGECSNGIIAHPHHFTSSCCLVQAGQVGCDTQEVQECVCQGKLSKSLFHLPLDKIQSDPFCCDKHWDVTCVENAKQCGATDCPHIENEVEVVDSTISSETETTAGTMAVPVAMSTVVSVAVPVTISTPAPIPSWELCCSSRQKPGCSFRPEVQTCVCAMDASCCTELWDDKCAKLAVNCNLKCPDTKSIEVNETTNCCVSSAMLDARVGCEEFGIQTCVCHNDPLCCKKGWDATCARWAKTCGSKCQVARPFTDVEFTSCCTTSEKQRGCDNPSVEQCVCDIDSYCCNGHWDGVCARKAYSFCGATCQAVVPLPFCDDEGGDDVLVTCSDRYGPHGVCIEKKMCGCTSGYVLADDGFCQPREKCMENCFKINDPFCSKLRPGRWEAYCAKSAWNYCNAFCIAY